jgi:hypothetical protein
VTFIKEKKYILQQDLLGKNVVLQLTEHFWEKWHHINTKKKRTAVALQGQIEKTVQQNSGNQLLKMRRGESRKLQQKM